MAHLVMSNVAMDDTLTKTNAAINGAGANLTFERNRITKSLDDGIQSNCETSAIRGNEAARVEGTGIDVRRDNYLVESNFVSGAALHGFSIPGNGNTVKANKATGSKEFDVFNPFAAGVNTYSENKFKTVSAPL